MKPVHKTVRIDAIADNIDMGWWSTAAMECSVSLTERNEGHGQGLRSTA